MAMDNTDRKLVNGLIAAAVLVGVIYFYPFSWPIDGYSTLATKEAAAKEALRNVEKNYDPYYAPMRPIHYGERETGEVTQNTDAAPMADLNGLYDQANKFTLKKIEEKQEINKIAFPEWTDIPAEQKAIPGHYFRFVWAKDKNKIANMCVSAGVELDDPDIGFARISGLLPDENKTKEYLRELHIAEKIIELCVQSKQHEEAREKAAGKTSEAFMRIMQVEPRDSEPTGPTALLVNPKFDPFEKNPASPKFRKYNVQSWPVFIQEYPVKIQLICDTNTFIHFMHSVRTQGQFLVIRQLEILSPFLDDSKNDKTEQRDFKSDATDEKSKKKWPQKDEQVVVTMNVSGMDFFDPKEYPRGKYLAKVDPGKASQPGSGRRRVLGPTTRQPKTAE